MKYNVDVKAADDFAKGLGVFFNVPLGFAGELDLSRYENPVVSVSTDGIGTKLELYKEDNNYADMGMDLVACVVNDILCTGAEPLGFLDYVASNKMNTPDLNQLLWGINEACEFNGIKLLGGETAQLDTLHDGQLELAGFGIGVREKQLNKSIDVGNSYLSDSANFANMEVKRGDMLVGVPSSGPHSNGFTLIREIMQKRGIGLNDDYNELGNIMVKDAILRPTQNYTKCVMALKQLKIPIKRIANITGGGLEANISRVVPKELDIILTGKHPIPEIYFWLQRKGDVNWVEMWQTFNMGIGMVFVIDPEFGKYIAGGVEVGFLG